MFDPKLNNLIGRLIVEIKQLVEVIMNPRTNDLGRINALGPMYQTKLARLMVLKPDLSMKDFSFPKKGE